MDWNYGWNKKFIELKKAPRARKKMTATRLAGVLGLNDWVTPFQMWCEITKACQPPFEDNKYTLAGKAIEPKLIQWVRDNIYDLEPELVFDPQQYFGNIYKDVKYDFFKDVKVFGGMWDAVHLNAFENEIDVIIECKTTGRPQDWQHGVPTYYKIQGLMYAYLTGASAVIFPIAFLKDEDYAHPEEFVCNDKNTTYFTYPVSEKIEWQGDLYDIEELMNIAMEWYDAYVETGKSPDFDEIKDESYLSILRRSKPSEDLGLDAMTTKALQLEDHIKKLKAQSNIDSYEKELKALKDNIKNELMSQMQDKETEIVYNRFNLSKSISKKLDIERMMEDGIYDKYVIEETNYKLTIKKGE